MGHSFRKCLTTLNRWFKWVFADFIAYFPLVCLLRTEELIRDVLLSCFPAFQQEISEVKTSLNFYTLKSRMFVELLKKCLSSSCGWNSNYCKNAPSHTSGIMIFRGPVGETIEESQSLSYQIICVCECHIFSTLLAIHYKKSKSMSSECFFFFSNGVFLILV